MPKVPSEGGGPRGGRVRGAMSDVVQQKRLTWAETRLLVNKSPIFHIVALCWGKSAVAGRFGASLVPWGFSASGRGGRREALAGWSRRAFIGMVGPEAKIQLVDLNRIGGRMSSPENGRPRDGGTESHDEMSLGSDLGNVPGTLSRSRSAGTLRGVESAWPLPKVRRREIDSLRKAPRLATPRIFTGRQLVD